MDFESINPTTEALESRFDFISDDKLTITISSLHKGFHEWSNYDLSHRAQLFNKCANHLEQSQSEFAKLMADEMGKPVTQGLAEIQKCADVCRYYANHTISLLKTHQNPHISYQPLGVLLGIMPWNFPFWQVFRFIIPTMIMGNTCLIKHAPNIPKTTLAINQLLHESGFNQDIFSSIFASHEQIESIIQNPKIVGVSLTGSEKAGRTIAKLAGQHLKKVVLELGGSDPFIVFEDSNINLAVKTAVRARFTNAGQVCISAKRFLIQESIFKIFQEKFLNEVSTLKIGNPQNKDTTLGPLARKDIMETIHKQVEESLNLGAKKLYGNVQTPEKGWFYPPTILTHVKKGMPVYDNETFGPVAVLIPFKNCDEAIQLANDTQYGLGASIWTQDNDIANRCSNQIQAGAVFINAQVTSMPELPFGGIKSSGFGRELGVEGLTTFCNIKTIYQG